MQTGKKERRAGVLMPVSSLPSDCGIGTLGAGAYAFIDWLHAAGMKIWQVLPLLPTGYGDSPYQSCAADALNPYFIDFATLVQEGLLDESDYKSVDWSYDERRVDYGKQFEHKIAILQKAFARFDKNCVSWKAFLSESKYADYALFMSLKTKFSYAPWTGWVEPYRSADPFALTSYAAEYKDEIEFWQFTQYIFLKQWNALKAYAHERGIAIMGDMPIYVAEDSV
ncbi:MAG: 4-alpha-glucanotransferase [Clostridia bacterium]|nr:4-alpha-glucanotransferase [Clostridia bacterium]